MNVLGIRRLARRSLPSGGQERRLLRHVPTELRERALHEAAVDGLCEVLRGERARNAFLLIEPLEDRLVHLTPELRVRIDVRRLVEIVVRLDLLEQDRLRLVLEIRVLGYQIRG